MSDARKPHANDCPRSCAYASDRSLCTCGEYERRRACREAMGLTGLSGRAARKAQRYEHAAPPSPPTLTPHPSELPHDFTPVWIEMHMPKGFTTVVLPDALVQDLIDARTACEECGDLNAGDQQRANLRELQVMKTVCEMVRKAYKP